MVHHNTQSWPEPTPVMIQQFWARRTRCHHRAAPHPQNVGNYSFQPFPKQDCPNRSSHGPGTRRTGPFTTPLFPGTCVFTMVSAIVLVQNLALQRFLAEPRAQILLWKRHSFLRDMPWICPRQPPATSREFNISNCIAGRRSSCLDIVGRRSNSQFCYFRCSHVNRNAHIQIPFRRRRIARCRSALKPPIGMRYFLFA